MNSLSMKFQPPFKLLAVAGFGLLALSGCAQNTAKPDGAATPATDTASLSTEDQVALFVNHARNGEYAELARAIKAGIPINQRDALDQTALIAAVSHNADDCVKLLLDHGADPKITDNAGWTPLIFAAYFGGDDELLKLLLDRGSDINARNDRGLTALYLAAATGHEPQVKLLLAHGADPSIASNSGYTPLRIAQLKSLDPIIALLDPKAAKTSSSAPTPAPSASKGGAAVNAAPAVPG